MTYKYIYHHLGLGDHIICNGLVRHFTEDFDKVIVFCKTQYKDNIEYMYRDDKKITVLDFPDDSDIIRYISNSSDIFLNLVVAGHGPKVFPGLRNIDEYINGMGLTFDRAFYEMAGVPFEYRFSKYYFERDLDRESYVYEQLNPNNEKYIYIQDDASRGFAIDRSKIRTDLKIIENDMRFNIFEYLKILENAEEIHIMESSIQNLINSYWFDKPELFLHKYVRNYPPLIVPVGQKEYKEIY
jgi:hypothetical protein